VPVAALLTPEAIAADVDRLLREPERTPSAQPHPPRPGGDTVAITAVAEDGTAISLIQSLFHSFGSRLRDPDTGVVLHNRGAFFSTDPASPNRVAPGRRPAHTLMPVLVERADGAVTSLGTMGGRAQPQIHAQILRGTLAGRTPAEAVAAPRFVVGGLETGARSDVVLAEEDLGSPALDELRATGLAVRLTHPWDEEVGHAMICTLAADGGLSAGADPRSDGGTFVG